MDNGVRGGMRQPKLENVVKITQIISNVGVIFVLLGFFLGIQDAKQEAKNAAKSIRASTVGPLQTLINKDTEIQKAIETFEIFLKKENSTDDFEVLLSKYGTSDGDKIDVTGRTIYYNIENLAKICRHYELLGAMVKLDYIDFDLVFEVIAFPDDFWNQSEALRKNIKDNWKEKGEELPDFLRNFQHLQERYVERREQEKREQLR